MSSQRADTGMSHDGSVAQLNESVSEYYDKIADIFEELWGEHIHLGYWDLDAPDTPRDVAIRRTTEEVVKLAAVPRGSRVLDIGFGYGASAIMLARDLDCTVEGITLSGKQVRLATAKAAEAGVGDRTSFRVMDALRNDYPDNSFDLVWAVESIEVMPDKRAFLAECQRLLKPGGKLVVVTWLCRDDKLTPEEIKMLRRIYRDFVIAYTLPMDHYVKLCRDVGFMDVETADWTENSRATWNMSLEIVMPLVRRPSYVWQLIRIKGWDIFRFFNQFPLMKRAFDRGLMRYGAFTAVKPG